jgi:hypothetical protein
MAHQNYLFSQGFSVNSEDVSNDGEYITSEYEYESTSVSTEGGRFVATPTSSKYTFKTEAKVPKLGMMIVGLGGNNGSTMAGALVANKLNMKWETKGGQQSANFFGSITQSSTTMLGNGPNGEECYVPLKSLLPMVEPNDVVIGGWDISSMNLADAMKRSRVYEPELQAKLRPHLEVCGPASHSRPRPLSTAAARIYLHRSSQLTSRSPVCSRWSRFRRRTTRSSSPRTRANGPITFCLAPRWSTSRLFASTSATSRRRTVWTRSS